MRGRAFILTMCTKVLLPKKWEVENKSFPLNPFVTFAFGLLNFFFVVGGGFCLFFVGKHLKYFHLIFLSQLYC